MISFHRDLDNLGDASRFRNWWMPADIEDVSRIALGISRFPWSGIQWFDGYRHERNFGRAAWCVLDFDDSELTLEQAKRVFCDSIHIIGTTKSHQKLKNSIVRDRFRVVLKFDEVIHDLATYRASMAYYIAKYDADPSCKDGARFFWPCTEIVSHSADGYTQQLVEPPPPREPRDYSAYREEKAIPHWIEGLLRFGCPDGMRNTTCFRVGLYLTLCGFSEDEVVDLLMASPIPVSKSPAVAEEVVKAVRNGAKVAKEQLREQETGTEEDPQGRSGDEPVQADERDAGP